MAGQTSELWTRSVVTVYDGRLEAFVQLVEDLLSTIRDKDLDTLDYAIFLDKPRGEAIILGHYMSSGGWQDHKSNLGALVRRFQEVCRFIAIEVYGDPTPEARNALDATFEGVGVDATYCATLSALWP
jgi:hypothetical protein